MNPTPTNELNYFAKVTLLTYLIHLRNSFVNFIRFKIIELYHLFWCHKMLGNATLGALNKSFNFFFILKLLLVNSGAKVDSYFHTL